MAHSRDELVRLTTLFLEAFNSDDLDGVVASFADEGVYEEFNGTVSKGHAEVRAAFEPQFTGRYGEMRFLDEDLFADAATGKVMVSWRCTLEVKGEPTSWRGLDLLHWQTGVLIYKGTYAKAKAPLFE